MSLLRNVRASNEATEGHLLLDHIYWHLIGDLEWEPVSWSQALRTIGRAHIQINLEQLEKVPGLRPMERGL